MITITIPINPVPAARPRVTSKGWTYYPKSYKEYKKDAVDYVRIEWSQRPIITVPVVLSFWFDIQVPKSLSRPKKQARINSFHTAKPDLDNLIKAAEDVLVEAGFLYDDSLVVAYASARKAWVLDEPKTEIGIIFPEGKP